MIGTVYQYCATERASAKEQNAFAKSLVVL